jgi:hypothetical protein
MHETTAKLIDALTIAERDKMLAILEAERTAIMEDAKKDKDSRKLYAVLVLDDITANLRCGGRPLPYK